MEIKITELTDKYLKGVVGGIAFTISLTWSDKRIIAENIVECINKAIKQEERRIKFLKSNNETTSISNKSN